MERFFQNQKNKHILSVPKELEKIIPVNKAQYFENNKWKYFPEDYYAIYWNNSFSGLFKLELTNTVKIINNIEIYNFNKFKLPYEQNVIGYNEFIFYLYTEPGHYARGWFYNYDEEPIESILLYSDLTDFGYKEIEIKIVKDSFNLYDKSFEFTNMYCNMYESNDGNKYISFWFKDSNSFDETLIEYKGDKKIEDLSENELLNIYYDY